MSPARADNRYAIPLSALEREAHVDAHDLVEEIAEAPAPDLIPEERRKLESFLRYGVA